MTLDSRCSPPSCVDPATSCMVACSAYDMAALTSRYMRREGVFDSRALEKGCCPVLAERQHVTHEISDKVSRLQHQQPVRRGSALHVTPCARRGRGAAAARLVPPQHSRLPAQRPLFTPHRHVVQVLELPMDNPWWETPPSAYNAANHLPLPTVYGPYPPPTPLPPSQLATRHPLPQLKQQ